MDLLKDEVHKKASQLAQYGTFIPPTKEDQEKAYKKEAPRMPQMLSVPIQAHQAEVIRMSTSPEPIMLSLDDIVTLEVKPGVRVFRFLNINITDEIKELIGNGQQPSIQLDEVLLEPGTKHILSVSPDYRFSMSVFRDGESIPIDAAQCIEPNCEGRLLKKRITVVPSLENIVRLAQRGNKLQLPLLFFCSALHFNGNKFTIKVTFTSLKPYKPSFVGTFSVWTTEKYLLETRVSPSQTTFTSGEALSVLGQAVMDIEEKEPPSNTEPINKGSVAAVLG